MFHRREKHMQSAGFLVVFITLFNMAMRLLVVGGIGYVVYLLLKHFGVL